MQRLRLLALVLATILILAALLFRVSRTRTEPSQYNTPEFPVIGKEGSEHTHMSILLFINDEAIDFSQTQYQLQSPLVHFEDGDGVIVHKHATGITLPYLFETLDMRLTGDCISLSEGRTYCNEGSKRLRTYLNRKEYVDWDRYELRWGDKILIDYGSTSDIDIGLRLNSVPDVPDDL